jgi:hypothetical protein
LQTPLSDSIVPDRLRKVPSRSTHAKCLSPLNLVKMTISLTVFDKDVHQNAIRDKHLANQLMFEWE